MKLINLWPNTKRMHVSPKRMFLNEVFAFVLLAAVLLSVAYGYLLHKMSEINEATQTLTQSYQKLNSNELDTSGTGEGSNLVATSFQIKKSRSGKLNWLTNLPNVVTRDVRWISADYQNDVLALVGVSKSAESAQQATFKLKEIYGDTNVDFTKMETKESSGQQFVEFSVMVRLKGVNKVKAATPLTLIGVEPTSVGQMKPPVETLEPPTSEKSKGGSK